jgi:hypothetical protein
MGEHTGPEVSYFEPDVPPGTAKEQTHVSQLDLRT